MNSQSASSAPLVEVRRRRLSDYISCDDSNKPNKEVKVRGHAFKTPFGLAWHFSSGENPAVASADREKIHAQFSAAVTQLGNLSKKLKDAKEAKEFNKMIEVQEQINSQIEEVIKIEDEILSTLPTTKRVELTAEISINIDATSKSPIIALEKFKKLTGDISENGARQIDANHQRFKISGNIFFDKNHRKNLEMRTENNGERIVFSYRSDEAGGEFKEFAIIENASQIEFDFQGDSSKSDEKETSTVMIAPRFLEKMETFLSTSEDLDASIISIDLDASASEDLTLQNANGKTIKLHGDMLRQDNLHRLSIRRQGQESGIIGFYSGEALIASVKNFSDFQINLFDFLPNSQKISGHRMVSLSLEEFEFFLKQSQLEGNNKNSPYEKQPYNFERGFFSEILQAKNSVRYQARETIFWEDYNGSHYDRLDKQIIDRIYKKITADGEFFIVKEPDNFIKDRPGDSEWGNSATVLKQNTSLASADTLLGSGLNLGAMQHTEPSASNDVISVVNPALNAAVIAPPPNRFDDPLDRTLNYLISSKANRNIKVEDQKSDTGFVAAQDKKKSKSILRADNLSDPFSIDLTKKEERVLTGPGLALDRLKDITVTKANSNGIVFAKFTKAFSGDPFHLVGVMRFNENDAKNSKVTINVADLFSDERISKETKLLIQGDEIEISAMSFLRLIDTAQKKSLHFESQSISNFFAQAIEGNNDKSLKPEEKDIISEDLKRISEVMMKDFSFTATKVAFRIKNDNGVYNEPTIFERNPTPQQQAPAKSQETFAHAHTFIQLLSSLHPLGEVVAGTYNASTPHVQMSVIVPTIN